MIAQTSVRETLGRRLGDYKKWRDDLIIVISRYHGWLQEEGLTKGEDDLRIFELIEALRSDNINAQERRDGFPETEPASRN